MPIPIGLIQAGIGAAQAGIGGVINVLALSKLNKLQSPQYTQNKSILDYYNTALQRYGVSPTDSAMYKRQQNQINRGLSTGVSMLNDRRSGTAGVSSLLRAANDASLDAGVAAEAQRDRRFGELGMASQLKAGEDDKAFQYNQYMPFERKYNLLAAKAGGGTQVANAGISNIFGGLQSANMTKMIDKLYK